MGVDEEFRVLYFYGEDGINGARLNG